MEKGERVFLVGKAVNHVHLRLERPDYLEGDSFKLIVSPAGSKEDTLTRLTDGRQEKAIFASRTELRRAAYLLLAELEED